MNYTIKNDFITLTVSDRGAEMMSIIKDGCEYLWQGDATYWAGRACNLFPICGRLTDGIYKYKGNTYEMILHGFAKVSDFEMIKQTDTTLSFLLKANEETKKIYPFDFEYYVDYTLNKNTIEMKYTAKNLGDNTMYSAFGGHPGFNVPLDNGGFEDYYIEFKCEKPARRLEFNHCYFTDNTSPFPLIDGKRFDLKHNLFDNDAIFLRDVCHTVSLKSDKTNRSVTVKYPDMQYVGFWHKPETDAPYVCIEPWQSVPAYYNVVDDLETKKDLYPLEKGEERTAQIDMIIE
jgi:galactose mutarotase-like enzyme